MVKKRDSRFIDYHHRILLAYNHTYIWKNKTIYTIYIHQSTINHALKICLIIYHPCMVYLPTFTIKINQMYVNMPYVDGTGNEIAHIQPNHSIANQPTQPGVSFSRTLPRFYWWKKSGIHQLRLVVCLPWFTRFQHHPRWLSGFLNHQQYGI